MTDSTASDQAKTSEERIEQHLSHLSSTASWLQRSVSGIRYDIQSCVNGQVLVMGVAFMLFLVMLFIFFQFFMLPGHGGDLMTVDSSIHALDRRLARIETLLQTRLNDSGLEQQLIRIEGVLRERLPLRQ